MRKLVLYADTMWTSPYVFSVFVTLREKGLPFDIESVALESRAQDSEAYRSLSLTSRVPALVHDDFVLSESSAIVEYLEDLFPSPAVLPKSPRDRARARQIMAWVRSDLMPIREERPTSTFFYQRPGKPLSAKAEAAAQKLLHVAQTLVPKEGGDLFGAWSIADADLAMMLQRLVANGHTVPEHIRAYVNRQWQRPSVREFVEHARPAFVQYG